MTGQTDAILAYLRQGNALTPKQGLSLFGTMRLAARIAEARERLDPGEVIVTEPWTTPTGARVAQYHLERWGQAKLWPDRKRPPVMT